MPISHDSILPIPVNKLRVTFYSEPIFSGFFDIVIAGSV
jgi:hypothetical protein